MGTEKVHPAAINLKRLIAHDRHAHACIGSHDSSQIGPNSKKKQKPAQILAG
jgi:hypothetical protein